jgi:hypothetical protein
LTLQKISGIIKLFHNQHKEGSTMRKKILTVLTTFSLLFSAVPEVAHFVSADESDFVIENGVLVAYNGSGGDVTIPDGVTSIGNSVFFDRRDITSVVIPHGVTSIGYSAFSNCIGLTSIIIPSSVTHLGESSFAGSGRLADIVFLDPYNIEWIGMRAFGGSVGFPHAPPWVNNFSREILYIGKIAYMWVGPPPTWGEFSITLKEGTKVISPLAFATPNLGNLVSVVFPESIKAIGRDAFVTCNGLTTLTFNSATPPHFDGDIRISNVKNVYVPCGAIQTYADSLNSMLQSQVNDFTIACLDNCNDCESAVVTQQPTTTTTPPVTTEPPTTSTPPDTTTEAAVSRDYSHQNITSEILAEMVSDGRIPRNVTSLNLSNNQIRDISPLSKLSDLVELNISHNRISDLTPLSELRLLGGAIGWMNFNLDFSHNQIRDLSPLRSNMIWRNFNLSNNQINDLTPLHIASREIIYPIDIRNNPVSLGQVNAMIEARSASSGSPVSIVKNSITHNAISAVCKRCNEEHDTLFCDCESSCITCGAVVSGKFCSNCGNPVTTITPPVTTAPLTTTTTSTPEPVPPTIEDALNILMQLAGLPNNAPSGSTIEDALQILMFLAGLPSVFDKQD